MTDDKRPREWIVPAEWQVSGKKFDAAATVRVVEGSAYDSLAERLKVAEAELLNTKELSSKLVEENERLKAEVERLNAELKSWSAISECCGRTRAEIYAMSHQLKAGKYAEKPKAIPSCICGDPANLKVHDEICDILEGNAWNEAEVSTASVGIWAALKWYEKEREITSMFREALDGMAKGHTIFEFPRLRSNPLDTSNPELKPIEKILVTPETERARQALAREKEMRK